MQMRMVNISTPEFTSTYTPKRAECTERIEARIMISAVLRNPVCPRILEIGTQFGDMTTNFAKVVKPLGGVVVTVDIVEIPKTLPEIQGTDCRPLKEIGSRIPGELRSAVTQVMINPNEPMALERALDASTSTAGKYDMVFIDGDHSYEGVKSDYETVKTRLTPNGIIFFHDVWWDVVPPPVDGPIRLLTELGGIVLNLSHLGVLDEHLCLLLGAVRE